MCGLKVKMVANQLSPKDSSVQSMEETLGEEEKMVAKMTAPRRKSVSKRGNQ